MNIILHIGSDKTGTSAIQKALHKHHHALKELGIIYPKLNNSNHHGSLAVELKAGRQGSAWKKLKTCMQAEPDTIIISSEVFCTLSKKDIILLSNWLKPESVTVLSYLRTADQYLESGLMQNLKSCKSEQDFKRLYLTAKWLPALINPLVYQASLKSRFVLKWNKHFKPKRMIVRQYHKNLWKNGNIIDDFLYQTSIDKIVSDIRIESSRENITPCLEEIYSNVMLQASETNLATGPDLKQQYQKQASEQLPTTSLAKRKLAYYLSKLIHQSVVKKMDADFIEPEFEANHHAPSINEIREKVAQKPIR